MEAIEIKQITEKILAIKNEKEVLKNLGRFGEFLAERGIIASEMITDIIYSSEPNKADDRFIHFTSGYTDGVSLRLEKVLTDYEIGR